MTFLEKKNSPKTRVSVSDIEGAWEPQKGRDKVSRGIEYHDGDDRYQTLEAMCERYAVEVKKEMNGKGEIETYVAKTVTAKKAAIKNNLYEVVNLGLTRKISSLVASLVDTSKWTYTKDGKPADDDAESITEEREEGSFDLRLSRVDELSVLTGCSAMLTQVLGGKYNYQPIPLDRVWVVFGETVQQDEDERPVDTLNLEDAQVVIIQLAEEEFVAYFGRSDVYEQGRCVKYESENWAAIPDVNDDTADDYRDDSGEVANPLTMWQDDQSDWSTPEYPIIIWQGTSNGVGKTIMPVMLNLVDASREIDLSASRTSMSANKGARGAWLLTSSAGSQGGVTPPIDEGMAALKEGQSAVVLTVPSGNIETASKVNQDAAAYLSDSIGVPAYQISVDQGANFPSGAALIEAQKPLNAMRQKRYKLNRAEMAKQFEIEKALAGIETGDPVAVDVKQNWVVAPIDVQKTDLEILEEEEKRIAMKISDKVNAIVATNRNVESREDAEAYLEQLEPEVVAVAPTNGLRRTIGTNIPS